MNLYVAICQLFGDRFHTGRQEKARKSCDGDAILADGMSLSLSLEALQQGAAVEMRKYAMNGSSCFGIGIGIEHN